MAISKKTTLEAEPAGVGSRLDRIGESGTSKRPRRRRSDDTLTSGLLQPVRASRYAPVKAPAADQRERVLVMDGHPMVEEWVGTLIGGVADLLSAGPTADLEDTASLVAQGRPTLVVLEIAADIPRGLEILRMLKAGYPELRVLVFSSCDEAKYSAQVLRAGARGFIGKTANGRELMRAIQQVIEGGVYLSSAMIGRLASGDSESVAEPELGPVAILSERELQVFTFVGEGLRPTEIAQRISLSVKTVESYLARIRDKLNLRDARALFQDAVKWSKARN